MTTYNEPKHLGDVLLVEVARGWTRDKGIFAAGQKVELGAVLARDADGKFSAYAPAAADTAPAVAVAAEAVDATAGERAGVVIARGATVATTALAWPDDITPEQIARALGDLARVFIIARDTL